MEKNNTREEILRVALDLFSVNGYESTSISQIADAVGVKKASIYSHFANKQEIMDTLVEMVLDGYERRSVAAVPHHVGQKIGRVGGADFRAGVVDDYGGEGLLGERFKRHGIFL